MFNLYKNAIDPNSFIGLVGKGNNVNSVKQERENRWIISAIATLSLLIMSVIANGSQAQSSFEAEHLAVVASYSSVA